MKGGAVASWLVRSSPEWVVRVRALAGDIVLCSWARYLTLTVPLSTLGKPNKLRGNDLRWTSILSRGSRNTPSRFMLQKPGISSGSYGPLGSKGFIFSPKWLTNVVFKLKQNCHNTTQNGIKYYFTDLQILKADTRFWTDNVCRQNIQAYSSKLSEGYCLFIILFKDWKYFHDNFSKHHFLWLINDFESLFIVFFILGKYSLMANWTLKTIQRVLIKE